MCRYLLSMSGLSIPRSRAHRPPDHLVGATQRRISCALARVLGAPVAPLTHAPPPLARTKEKFDCCSAEHLSLREVLVLKIRKTFFCLRSEGF